MSENQNQQNPEDKVNFGNQNPVNVNNESIANVANSESIEMPQRQELPMDDIIHAIRIAIQQEIRPIVSPEIQLSLAEASLMNAQAFKTNEEARALQITNNAAQMELDKAQAETQ